MTQRTSATRDRSTQRREPEAATQDGPVVEQVAGLRPVAGLAVRRTAGAGEGLGGRIRRLLTGTAAITAAASTISQGHAFRKHKREFTRAQAGSKAKFESHVQHVIENATESKDLRGGRSAYWDDASGTIVIHDPATGDQGTCFKPTDGKAYYDRQR